MYFKSNSLTKLYIPDAESYKKTTDLHISNRMLEECIDKILNSRHYNMMEAIGTTRCPHCGVSLTPSDSLTAIEKRRESEKSGKDPDLK